MNLDPAVKHYENLISSFSETSGATMKVVRYALIGGDHFKTGG